MIQRLTLISIALITFAASSVLSAAPGATYYVSTTGSDANAGTIGAPFASIERARDAIRDLKSGSGLPSGGVEVLIRGGTYPVTEAIILTNDDVGTAANPIVYKAFPTEQVIFDGSKTIDSSFVQPVTNTALKNSVIDATARTNLRQIDLTAAGITPAEVGALRRMGFSSVGNPYVQDAPAQFFIDSERQLLASWPNSMLDGVTIANVVNVGPTALDGDPDWLFNGGTFEYSYNRPALWTYSGGTNPADLWIQGVFRRDWQNSFNKVETLNTSTKRVTMAYGEVEGIEAGADGKFHQYVNVPEEIDTVGEYWIDRTSNMLYFYAPASYSDLRMSVLGDNMLMLDRVRYVTFEDIYFRYGRASGVMLLTCSDVVIKNCEIANFGVQAGVVRTGDDALETFKQDWTTVHGDAWETRVFRHTGGRSYIPNEDQDQIKHTLSAPTSTDLSVYMHDYTTEAPTDVAAAVYDSVSGKTVRIGLHTSTSTTNYSYDIGNGVWVASSVSRSNGWQNLEIDIANDELRINGTTIATGLDISQFDEVLLGDETDDGLIGIAHAFDTVKIDGGNLLDNGFETDTRRNSAFYRNGFRNCRVYGIGGQAFTLFGGGSIDTPGENFIEHCEISDFSYWDIGWNPAISILQAGNRASHNKIYDAPHVAITNGGVDTLIEYNEIHDVVKLITDMGAIYQAGNGDYSNGGLVIRRNHFYDIGQDVDLNNAIFLDNQYHDATITENFFRNIGKSGFSGTDAVKLNGAGYIKMINNVFLDARRPIWHTKNNLENTDNRQKFLNIMNSQYGGSFAGSPRLKYPHIDDGVGFAMKLFVEWDARDSLIQSGDNIVYLPAGNEANGNVFYNPNLPLQGGAATGIATNFNTQEAMSKAGNWVATSNPGFVDYANGDLNFQPGADVFTQIPGFPDIPFDQIGPIGTVGPSLILDPPVADAGLDQTIVDSAGDGESVTLDGSGSGGGDGSITSYSWSESASEIATGVSPSVNLNPGLHVITLTVTNDNGAFDTDTVMIEVLNPESPAVSNGSAIDITRSGATVSGSLDDGNIADLRLYWGTTDGGTTIASWEQVTSFPESTEGSYEVELTGLSAGTTYFYRWYATNSADSDWASATLSFSTLAPIIPTTSLELWLDGNDLDGDGVPEGLSEDGLTSSVVEVWTDKSGNLRDAVGVAGKSSLNLINGALNSGSVVRSSGDDQLDIGGSAFAVQTVIAVVNASQEPFNSFRRIMRSPTGGLNSGIVNALLVNGTNGSSIYSTMPQTGADSANVIIDGIDINTTGNSETFGSPHSRHRIVVAAAGAATRAVDDWYISETGTNNFWLGDFAEVIVYSRALSPAELEAIGVYLEDKWGLSSVYGPLLSSTFTPAHESNNALIDTDLAITFNEALQKGTGNVTIKRLSDNGVVEEINVTSPQVSVSGATVTITPSSDLDFDTAYYVEIDSGAVTDVNGESFVGFTGSGTWQFTTERDEGLIWHSRLDGTAEDTIGSVDGTLNGDTMGTTNRFGEANSALIFDGVGDNVIINKSTLPASFTAATISVWVQANPADVVTDDGFVGVGGTGGDQDQFFAIQTNADRYRTDMDRGGSGDTGRLDALQASSFNANWKHVVATFDVVTLKFLRLYVDGVQVDEEAIINTIPMIPTNNWTVGSSRTSERYWTGKVDDSGVWDIALTGNEVAALYDVSASSALGYDADDFERLRKIHAAGSGAVTIGSLQWSYATGLTQAAGLSGSSGAGFTLVLDAAADTGLVSTPAPVQLTVVTDGNGTIATPADGAYTVGTTVEVNPVPATYYSWGNWSGDVPGSQVNEDPLQLLMDQDRTITANFVADLAVNDVPHWWLAQFGWTSDFDAFAVLDTDGDGLFAWEEFIAGTNPTDGNSALKVESIVLDPIFGDIEITWPSVAGKEYYLLESWDLSAWWRVSDAITATPPLNTYNYTSSTIENRAFYRVAIDPPAGLMVDFSSAQGYANGNLNGQPGSGLTWTENTNGTYQVDAAAGTATIDSNDANFRSALLDVTTGAATTATLMTEFTITAGTVQPASTITLLRSDFFTASDGLAIFSIRQSDGINTWNLQFFESSGTDSFFGSSPINGAEIGLTVSGGSYTDNESDLLRMTARHTLTDGQTQWAVEIKLENLATGTIVRTVSGQWEATTGFRDADKFLRLSTGSINDYGDAGATRVEIQRVIFTE
jgi:hypothetical protein